MNDRGTGNRLIAEAAQRRRAASVARWVRAHGQALLDLGMERGRIGVVRAAARQGDARPRAAGGHQPQLLRRRAASACRQATFVDATDVVGFARYVKSDEEIDALRRGAEIATAGIDEMVRVGAAGRGRGGAVRQGDAPHASS